MFCRLSTSIVRFLRFGFDSMQDVLRESAGDSSPRPCWILSPKHYVRNEGRNRFWVLGPNMDLVSLPQTISAFSKPPAIYFHRNVPLGYLWKVTCQTNSLFDSFVHRAVLYRIALLLSFVSSLISHFQISSEIWMLDRHGSLSVGAPLVLSRNVSTWQQSWSAQQYKNF